MTLSRQHEDLLLAMRGGWTLKSHRDVDGSKAYRLHPLEGPPREVPWAVVAHLQDRGLIDSNKKFPVATYWLTERGQGALSRSPGRPEK